MKVIKTKRKLVDLLFKRLKRSEPQHVVSANFLLSVGGICYGLTWRGAEKPPPYLASVLTERNTGRVVSCGAKLIEFSRSLARAGLLGNPQGCSATRLIKLMLKALDDDGLRIRKERTLACSYIVSTQAFARVHGVKVRVRLGSSMKPRLLEVGGPTDFAKLRAADQRAEWDAVKEEVAHLKAAKAQMRQEVSRLEGCLYHAQERVRFLQQELCQEVSRLQGRLHQAQERVWSLQQELSTRSHASANSAYWRIGLTESCPDFLLKAARAAYRKHYHPDPRPPHEKAEAEEKFKEAEGLFDTLYKLRQLT